MPTAAFQEIFSPKFATYCEKVRGHKRLNSFQGVQPKRVINTALSIGVVLLTTVKNRIHHFHA